MVKIINESIQFYELGRLMNVGILVFGILWLKRM